MKASVRDPEILRSVRPDDIEQYLVAHGWVKDPRDHRVASFYTQERDGTGFEILVPRSNDLRDFAERISELLRTLEIVEKRDQIRILNDLNSARADVVRIRRPGTVDGSIALEEGVGLVSAAFEMMLAAACATVSPRLYYPGRKPAAADNYVHNARLGQSERGSYVVTVISPIPPRIELELIPGLRDPFERQVTRMLSRALAATVQSSEAALRTGNPDAFREATADGVSANFLDSVLGLMGPFHQPVDVDLAWSPEHPLGFQPPQIVAVDPDFAPVLEEASRFLKRQAEQPPVQLLGIVVGLRRSEGAESGRATLATFLDGRPKVVSVELGPAEYDLAIRAHRQYSTVLCEGVLVRMGRTSVLTNLTSFTLAAEPEDEPEEPPLFDPGQP